MNATIEHTTLSRPQSEIDTALDTGKLWARMTSGRYWLCRRNGATQTWKTRPGEYRVPVKAGLRSYGAVHHYTHVGTRRGAAFAISETQP